MRDDSVPVDPRRHERRCFAVRGVRADAIRRQQLTAIDRNARLSPRRPAAPVGVISGGNLDR